MEVISDDKLTFDPFVWQGENLGFRISHLNIYASISSFRAKTMRSKFNLSSLPNGGADSGPKRQTPIVESLLDTKYCKLAVTDVFSLRLNCSSAVPNSQEGEVLFVNVCLSDSLTNTVICRILAYMLYMSSFLILPIGNMISFAIL